MTEKLFALDLFAGAGGLSLGFENAGFIISEAIEKDTWAADTFKKNRPDCEVICEDIIELSDSYLKKFTEIDVVIGGPPCQGFSISASNRRDPNDPRNFLYREFLRAVGVIRPRMVFLENVKEILKARIPTGEFLLNDFCGILSRLGYKYTYSLLNAEDFGIPQHRIRFFLVAGLDGVPDISKVGPGGRELPLFSENHPYLSIWDAISDLPSVVPRQHKEDDIFVYDVTPKNSYQEKMREGSNKIFNHIPMRHTDRTIERFKHIQYNSKQTVIPLEYCSRKRSSPSEISWKTYEQNHRKINPDVPSPTITASFYSSFIHPFEHRNLTVREAARIQSFPDIYRFYGKRTTLSKKLLKRKGIYEDLHLDQFNQVGNAVPPLLAKELATRIYRFLFKGAKN